jgi:hypothetical protein
MPMENSHASICVRPAQVDRGDVFGSRPPVLSYHGAQGVVGRRDRMYWMATGLVISTVST